MAYITDKERKGLIKDVHKTYTARKALILLNIILLFVFIILIFVSFYKADKDPKGFWNFFNVDYTTIEEKWTINGLSAWGVVMLIWGCIMVLMSLAIIILTFLIKSPNEVTKEVLKLESIPADSNKKVTTKASKALKNISISKINAERVGIETKK